jgi:hypothetical protein
MDVCHLNRRDFLVTTSFLGLGLQVEGLARAAEPAPAAPKAAKTEVKTAGIRLLPVDGKHKVWTRG